MQVIPDLDSGKALALAKEYLAGKWLKLTVDNVQVKPFAGGYCSRLYLCEDLTQSCDPNKFLVRFLGGKFIDVESMKHYNEGTECIVFFYHGHLGYGPKLYGSFSNGRIEEYIPSRCATHDDLDHEHIRKQIARKLAKFHSMKLPVSKKPFPPLDRALSEYKAFDTVDGRKEFAELSANCNIDPVWVDTINFYAEFDWLKLNLPKVSGRLVLSFNDMNLLNCLIRETPDQFGEIVTLIDYEVGGTNWRGYDIAFHFIAWTADVSKEGWRSTKDYPDAEIRRQFVTDYLNQAEELECYDVFDEHGLDSVDHVLMEADLHTLAYCLFLFSIVVKPKAGNAMFADRKTACNFIEWARREVQFYVERKKHFIGKYAAILAGDIVTHPGDNLIATTL